MRALDTFVAFAVLSLSALSIISCKSQFLDDYIQLSHLYMSKRCQVHISIAYMFGRTSECDTNCLDYVATHHRICMCRLSNMGRYHYLVIYQALQQYHTIT